MFVINMYPLLVLMLLHATSWDLVAALDKIITDETFTGWASFFPVKKVDLQKKLDVLNSKSNDYDVKFHLASEAAFHHLINDDEHLIILTYGHMSGPSFENVLGNGEYDNEYNALTFYVDAVSSYPEGPSKFDLSLSSFVDKSTDNLINPNICLAPETKADKFVVSHNSTHSQLDFANDGGALKISSKIDSSTCTVPPPTPGDDRTELNRSVYGADFSVCDQLKDHDVDMCNIRERYRDDIISAGSNICQYWTVVNASSCLGTSRITEIAPNLRDLFAIPDNTEELAAVFSVYLSGTFHLGLAIPCV